MIFCALIRLPGGCARVDPGRRWGGDGEHEASRRFKAEHRNGGREEDGRKMFSAGTLQRGPLRVPLAAAAAAAQVAAMLCRISEAPGVSGSVVGLFADPADAAASAEVGSSASAWLAAGPVPALQAEAAASRGDSAVHGSVEARIQRKSGEPPPPSLPP